MSNAVMCIALSCAVYAGTGVDNAVLHARLRAADGSEVMIRDLPPALNVLIFFSESCPMCQKYTVPLRAISARYGSGRVRFMLIFPDTATRADELQRFASKYRMRIPMYIDKQLDLTTAVDARVVPQVVVCDSTGLLLYSGRIDNWFAAPGAMRSVVSSHELIDVLEDIAAGRPIRHVNTPGPGCIIERPAIVRDPGLPSE